MSSERNGLFLRWHSVKDDHWRVRTEQLEHRCFGDGQLFEDLSLSGRSSETARMQDWPSNWILSAE